MACPPCVGVPAEKGAKKQIAQTIVLRLGVDDAPPNFLELVQAAGDSMLLTSNLRASLSLT